jgi:3-deoxy-D-manno-octulosonate 8-phosphate phosphatase (KDO 8-P phosphatase)
MKYWRRIGGKLAILSGRSSPAIEHRAADLEVDALRLGAKDKLPVFEEMLGELGVSPADTAVMGDDLPDLPLLRICGFSAAPHDAVPEVLREVRYITRATGGRGAVREFIEQIMRPTGQWERILQRYLPPEQRVGPAI